MPLICNPLRVPQFYDKLNVAGVDNPGLFVRLGGGGRKFKWDRKDPSGSQGATSTYRGWEVTAGIKAQFQFWEAEQIDEFYESYLPLLQYDATKQSPKPVDIFNPALLANDVQAISVDEIGVLEDLGKQLWSVTIEMSEFRPPPKKNATSTPKSAQASPDGSSQTKPSVEDKIDAEIAKERAQASRPLPTSPPS